MLKWLNKNIVFKEIPNEVTLAINLTNCPHHCIGCHSPILQEDIGDELTTNIIDAFCKQLGGFTCICFMGGDNDKSEVNKFAKYIKDTYPALKVAWYTGETKIPNEIELTNFDFIKIGYYDEKLGPLDSSTTNQCLLKVLEDGKILEDITSKFWKTKE